MTDGRKNSFDIESWYPSLIAGAIILTAVLLLSLSPLASWKPVFVRGCILLIPAALNVSVIAIGFLATALSILLSLADTRVVRILKQKGHHKRLIGFFRSGISISFFWALISALLSTFRWERGGICRYAALYVWVYTSICSVLCYYRASEILLEILMIGDVASARSTNPEWRDTDDGPHLELDFTEDKE
jgi:hypothetical protein